MSVEDKRNVYEGLKVRVSQLEERIDDLNRDMADHFSEIDILSAARDENSAELDRVRNELAQAESEFIDAMNEQDS